MAVVAWDCADDAYRERAYNGMAIEIEQLRDALKSSVAMPRELTDEQADAAMRATAVHLDIKGSQLTVNREKMKARYRSLVKYIEAGK